MSYKCPNCDKGYKSQLWLEKHVLKCGVKNDKCTCDASIKLSEMESELLRLKTSLDELKKHYDKLMIDSNYTVVEYGILMEQMLINNRFMESKYMEAIKENVLRKDYDTYIRKKAIERSNKQREEFMGKELYVVMKDLYYANKDADNESDCTSEIKSEPFLNHIFNKIYEDGYE